MRDSKLGMSRSKYCILYGSMSHCSIARRMSLHSSPRKIVSVDILSSPLFIIASLLTNSVTLPPASVYIY